jgi:hypothetical protein
MMDFMHWRMASIYRRTVISGAWCRFGTPNQMDQMPSRMQGLNIEQRDCAVYHINQSYKDYSGGEHITANAGLLENR